jgi:F-box interacting protein
VSKGWRLLISDPAFVALHKSLHAEPVVVLRSVNKNPDGSRDLRLMDMGGDIVRVIKTITCYADRMYFFSNRRGRDLICTTNDFSAIAEAAIVIDPVTGKVLADLHSELRYHKTVFGFGCAIASSVCKVVRLWCGASFHRGIGFTWECDVLTLGDGIGWRRSEMPPSHVSSSPVAVNGIMYFLMADRDDTLVPFDLESEKWRKTIEGPRNMVPPQSSRIAELNDTLCMVQLEAHGRYTEIWLLTNKDLWIKAYTVRTISATQWFTPLRITLDGSKLIFHCCGEVRVYDPHTETCRMLWKLEPSMYCIVGLCNLNLRPLCVNRDLVSAVVESALL